MNHDDIRKVRPPLREHGWCAAEIIRHELYAVYPNPMDANPAELEVIQDLLSLGGIDSERYNAGSRTTLLIDYTKGPTIRSSLHTPT